LGEAFGTIKLKQSIRAAARNEVDMEDLTSLAGVIEGAVDEKAANLPTIGKGVSKKKKKDQPFILCGCFRGNELWRRSRQTHSPVRHGRIISRAHLRLRLP